MAELVSANEGAPTSSSSAQIAAVAKKNPSDFLRQVLGKPVIVELNSGVSYRGILACLDGFMNIAMEQTEEYVDGQLKARYGDCFIRGNNGKHRSILSRHIYSNTYTEKLTRIFFTHSLFYSFTLVLYISTAKSKR